MARIKGSQTGNSCCSSVAGLLWILQSQLRQHSLVEWLTAHSMSVPLQTHVNSAQRVMLLGLNSAHNNEDLTAVQWGGGGVGGTRGQGQPLPL